MLAGVTVGDLYFNMGRWEQKDFIARLRLLLCGNPSGQRDGEDVFKPYQKGGGNDSWVLDEGNNWFLSFQPNNVAWLRYRYAEGLGMNKWEEKRSTEDVWKGLYHAVTTLMHLDPLTPEQEASIRK